MGYPMARNLLRAGHEVALWSHTSRQSAPARRDEKGVFCATPREVAEQADCIFLCVGEHRDVEARSSSARTGIIEGVRAGHRGRGCQHHQPQREPQHRSGPQSQGCRFSRRSLHRFDPRRRGRNLTFMIGGDQAVFEKTKPLFEPMGKRLYYCGGPGMGLQAKLTQNLILSNILMAFNEGMVLATKGGVDPKLMLDILDNSAAKSGLIAYKAPFVFRRDFTANFSTKWMHKDIGLMLESGKELGVPLLLTGLTRQLFQTAIAAGLRR